MIKLAISAPLSISAKEKLKQNGVKLLEFDGNPSVMPQVKYHSDLSFFYAGNNTVFTAAEAECTGRYLSSLGYCVIPLSKLKAEYPFDVPLNCVAVGKHFICNTDTVSKKIFQYFSDRQYEIIPVSQGYTKCSVVPVTDKALITDDESIFRECILRGLDVLKVSKGNVELEGFPYGFIGGASGKIGDNLIAFNGDINTHENGEGIKKFLSSHGISYISLDKGKLVDVGSIIPLY
ncbi:MAG: hypothetical protein LUG85_02695 [Clostridiales bacterium]|nr:hypothetical protein [Clostridiales bacterium]